MLAARTLRSSASQLRLRTHSIPAPHLQSKGYSGPIPSPGMRLHAQSAHQVPNKLSLSNRYPTLSRGGLSDVNTVSTSPNPSTVTAVGLVSGTLGAMCGVGGAVFAIPGLVRFAGLPQRVAAGNSLVAVTCVAATSAASFWNAGLVNVPVAMLLGSTAAILTPIGAYCSQRVAAGALRKALGGFMLLLAPAMPLRSWLESQRMEGNHEDVKVQTTRNDYAVIGIVGSTVGFLSGLLGISGGSLFTPLIAFMCPEGSFRTVLGTSFCAMILPTAVGALSYAKMGCVTRAVVPPIVAGAALGAGIGSTVALNVPEEVLRWGFAIVFTVLGTRILRAPIKTPAKATEKIAGTVQTQAVITGAQRNSTSAISLS